MSGGPFPNICLTHCTHQAIVAVTGAEIFLYGLKPLKIADKLDHNSQMS